LHYIGCSDPLEEAELIEHYLSGETVRNLDALLEFLNSDISIRDGFDKFKVNR
jgi:Mn-dependent DtxR family transcriptional regulator